MSTYVAGLITVVAIGAVYLFSVRPHLRGQRAMAGDSDNAEQDRQIADLRKQLRMLRAQDSLDTPRVPNSEPTPPDVGLTAMRPLGLGPAATNDPETLFSPSRRSRSHA